MRDLESPEPLPSRSAPSAPCDDYAVDALQYLIAMHTPRELDRKSLELHRLAVQKIKADPALFHLVQERLTRFMARTSAASSPYLMEWQSILDQGMDVALSVAVEDSERAQVLRSSSPFAGVLDEEERLAFLAAWASSRG